MKKSFFICLAAWLLFRTGAAEPVHSWDFNKEPLKPKLYGSELRDHALVCGEKHNNAATGFRNYFEAFTLELRFKPEEEFSKTNGGTSCRLCVQHIRETLFLPACHRGFEDRGSV